MDQDAITSLGEQLGVSLALLDLGASGGSYEGFLPVRGISTLIEVDADERDFGQATNAMSISKPQKIITRKAVIGSDTDDTVSIYLTEDPHCSSTLEPDMDKLRNFSYADLFRVSRRVYVPATSLSRLSNDLRCTFDWIKIDTQGSELDILQNMSPALLQDLLCCDAEVSFYAHYKGARALPEFHAFMLAAGFQVAKIVRVQSRVRMRASDLAEMERAGVPASRWARWPTSLEMRYIRSVSHDAHPVDLDRLKKIWLIAYATDNQAYCVFLANRIRELHPEHASTADHLKGLALRRMRSFSAIKQSWKTRLISLIERL